MKSYKSHRQVEKEELKNDEIFLRPPTQDMEENLEQGVDDAMPDPDDIPGGFSYNQKPRPDIIGANAQAIKRKKSK